MMSTLGGRMRRLLYTRPAWRAANVVAARSLATPQAFGEAGFRSDQGSDIQ